MRTFHNFFFASGWWRVKRRAQALASDRFVSAFISLSDEMAFHELTFGRQCEVIGNWVDDRFFSDAEMSIDPVAADIVVVGNCSQVKNHELVLEAALPAGCNRRARRADRRSVSRRAPTP